MGSWGFCGSKQNFGQSRKYATNTDMVQGDYIKACLAEIVGERVKSTHMLKILTNIRLPLL